MFCLRINVKGDTMRKRSILILCALLVTTTFFAGCATTGRLISNSSLKTKVVMTDPVFLGVTPKAKICIVKVNNTSDLKGVMLAPVLRDRLIKEGFTIVTDPEKASYIIQANITSFTARNDSSATDMSIAGTVMSGVAGAALASTTADAVPFAIAGAIVGNIGGAIIGSMFSVDYVQGTVDLQIQERADAPVTGTIRADVQQGTSTTLSTQQVYQSSFQTYRTKFIVSAHRTNINLDEAVAEITNKLADQIAGVFL